MRFSLAVAGISGLLLVGCSSKKSTEGLPPATEWGAGADPGANPGAMVPMPGTKTANPHGPGGVPMGDDPHKGVPGAPPLNGQGEPAAMGSDHPSVVMPEKTAPKTLEKLPEGRVALGPFSALVAPEWTEQPISSSMRAAHWKIGPDAELIVFYFGDTGAGPIEANIDRWLGQFTQPDGKASRDVAKIEKAKFANQEATLVSVSGRFVADAMPGASDAVDKQDQSLLAAIVDSPSGPYYFKLVGAKQTVATNAPRFRALLTSLKLR